MHQCSSDCDALTLPSGHLGGAPMTQISQSQATQNLAGGSQCFFFSLSGQTQRQGRILLDSELRKQFAVLEYEAEPFAT